jgi:hypothetical protein
VPVLRSNSITTVPSGKTVAWETIETVPAAPPDGASSLKCSVSLKTCVPPAVVLPPNQEAPARRCR